MKVAKFGGSSLSDAKQIIKVKNIVAQDSDIRYVVVSAPGKRDASDTKVTDLLIALYSNHSVNIDTQPIRETILNRYLAICEGLSLSTDIIDAFDKELQDMLAQIKEPARLLDALKSRGEDFNARLISQYLVQEGVNARYISPKEAGIIVSDRPGDALLLDEAYQEIAKLKNSKEVLVIPGFFGYSQQGEIVTFSRGGSDITGAIIARGVQADIYENFTDESFIYSAHPKLVKDPHPIKQVTYREMRELSYSGFTIFHDEALTPLYEVGIPVMIRNTNDPTVPGTIISVDRDDTSEIPVIGVAGDEGFLSITIKRYLLNKEVGFLRKYLQIFEDEDISIEHLPTGIDDVSIIIRSNQFKNDEQLNHLIARIQQEVKPDEIHVEKDLSVMVIVGEGMRNFIGVANRATEAFRQAGISLSMINQGASEISMFFAIKGENTAAATRALYQAYFTNIS